MIQPLDERVLVEPIKEDEKIGSILIPDTAQKRGVKGKIVAVGTDKNLNRLFKPGMVIIYGKYAGEEITVDNKKLLILQRHDILAVDEVERERKMV